MSDHTWVQENLGADLAGGLTPEERERLEQHVSGCAACTQELAAVRGLEQVMTNLFATIRPDVGLEDRVIKKLRGPSMLPRQSLGSGMRILLGVAAVLVVGILGAVVQAVATGDEFKFPVMQRLQLAANMKDERYAEGTHETNSIFIGQKKARIDATDLSNLTARPNGGSGRVQFAGFH